MIYIVLIVIGIATIFGMYPEWCSTQVFYDLDRGSLLVLSPFIIYYAGKLFLDGLARFILWRYKIKYVKANGCDPDMDVCGNDNIKRNFWDYM